MVEQIITATKPNLYELSGDGIKITYTLEPILGGPQFNYDDGKLSRVFKGNEIRTEDTEIGTLVTVTIQMKIDRGSTSFTVLIPKVGMGETTSQSITTVGITTVHNEPVVGPTPPGQDDVYTVHTLKGNAKIVRS